MTDQFVKNINAFCFQMCRVLLEKLKIMLFSRSTEDISKEKQLLKLLRMFSRLTYHRIPFTTSWEDTKDSTEVVVSKEWPHPTVCKMASFRLCLRWVKKGTTD